MIKLLNYIDRLIPIDLNRISEEEKIKVRVFVCILALTFGFCLIIFFIDNALQTPNAFPTSFLLFFLAALYAFFYKFKNYKASTNILLTAIFFGLGHTTYLSGGLFSDNLLYMVLVPLMAFLMLDVKSGVAWMGLLLGFQGLMYYLEKNYSGFLEDLILTADYYYVSIFFLFLMLGSFIYAIAKIQSYSYQRLKDQQVQLQSQKLELQEYADKLESYQDQILKSNKALQEFAYAASHDLKQPLRNITSFSKLLERNLEKREVLDEASEEFLKFIQEGGKNMTSLITDLMEYSKISSTHGENKSEINFPTLLEKIQFNLRELIRESNANIVISNIPGSIKGVEVKLLQLFQNLISNAIKFRKPDTPSVIKINAEEFDNHFRFSIADNGIGIEGKHQKEIFNLFYKLHSKDAFEGSGIGLSTCKAIVDQHGGKIWVESQHGHGSTFYFTILNNNKLQSVSQAQDNLILDEVKSN